MYAKEAYFKIKEKNVTEKKDKRNSTSVLRIAAGGGLLMQNT